MDQDRAVDVIHTAGVIHPDRTAQFFAVNADGTQNVLDAALDGRRAPVRARLVELPFGTNAHRNDRFRADEPFHPYLGYGRSKMMAELARSGRGRSGLDAVIVRPPWFYGPWQPPRQTRFFRMIRTGRFPVFGDGGQRRSMVYVGNLVDGSVRAELAAHGEGMTGSPTPAVRGERDRQRPSGRADAPRDSREVGITRLPAARRRLGRPRSPTGRSNGWASTSRPLHVLGEMSKTIAVRHLPRSPISATSPTSSSTRACAAASGGASTTGSNCDPAAPLVTGGSGYFGALLAERLRQRGDRVRVLDLNPFDGDSSIEFVHGDIRDAIRSRAAARWRRHRLPQRRPGAARTRRDPAAHGQRRRHAILLDACRDAGVAKIVHTSSSAVFGIPEHNPVLPSTVPRPVESYGHAKLAAEWACLAAVAEGSDVTIVRPRTILGHGRLGIFSILFDWIADGADASFSATGRTATSSSTPTISPRSCFRAGDAGSRHLQCRHRPLRHDARVAAVPVRSRRHRAAGALVARRAGRVVMRPPPVRIWRPVRAVPLDHVLRSMWFDIEHVPDALGWQPRWSNDEMFADSYDWFLRNRAEANEGGRSRHRTVAKQGALRAVKALTRLLPR